MKLIVFTLFFLTIEIYSQEQEFEDFKKQLNFYVDFTFKKFDSLPINHSNQNKFRKKTDDTFKKFVLHNKSNEFAKLIKDNGEENTKFLGLDGKGSIYLKTFIINNKTYIVYSYTSQPKTKCFIKNIESNKIVYEDESSGYFIDNIYSIDSTHFLLIKERGFLNKSRSTIVLLLNKKQLWTTTQSFSGNAFGQVPFQYFTKKFIKKRSYFQLECEIDFTLDKPADINKITFDNKTKSIAYKQYYENNKYALITAKWENNIFLIDDYNVNENLRGNGGLTVPK